MQFFMKNCCVSQMNVVYDENVDINEKTVQIFNLQLVKISLKPSCIDDVNDMVNFFVLF